MVRIKVFLKSGAVMEFDCEEFTTNYRGSELVAYEVLHGDSEQKCRYIRMDDVSAIVQEEK